MNITEIASPCYQDCYSQSYSATYSKDEVFTFTAATTDRPDYQPSKPLQKIIVENKYTFEVPDDITVNIGDEVICEAANNRMWIGIVTSLTSTFSGNCKKIKQNVKNWNFNQKLLFRIREDLRQQLAYLEATSNDAYADAKAYLDGVISKILGYRIDEEYKYKMISYLNTYLRKHFSQKEAA